MGETETQIGREAAREPAELQRIHTFDDRRLDAPLGGWPVDVPPFADGRFNSLWHRLQFVALRGAQRGVLALPGPLREALVRAVAATGRTFDRRHTAAAETYIRAALPDATDSEVAVLVRQAWRHLMRVGLLSEGIDRNLMGGRLGDHFEVRVCAEALELLEQGTGVILVTAHVGFWEACGTGVVTLGFTPAYAIGKAPRNDFVALEMQRMRESQGMRLIPRKGAMAVVPAAVRAGATVGMLLDHRPRQKPVIAPFFGRPAACDRSAGVLLRRVKAPLVFYGCYSVPGTDPLRDWRFDLRFPSVIQPEELEGLRPAEIAARINVESERLILHRPDEMFWLHDRFKEAPDSFPAESTNS